MFNIHLKIFKTTKVILITVMIFILITDMIFHRKYFLYIYILLIYILYLLTNCIVVWVCLFTKNIGPPPRQRTKDAFELAIAQTLGFPKRFIHAPSLLNTCTISIEYWCVNFHVSTLEPASVAFRIHSKRFAVFP